MKKRYYLIIAALIIGCLFFIKCAKINKDQPCGPYNNTNEQLYKDSNNKCYYIDNQTGAKVYVDASQCNC